ncbi:HAD family hydrolase [Salinibaculum rarum]|uniref:HAD family hydrolase n=1 Tax=Salinibaculum rarum TaxID=3058903 RepID=UPI00265FD030|nr:HAD family hydrolase [Salinibaculum sp. KK48]
MATSFDCFGTLVTAERPAAPWAAAAEELAARGISVPEDWEDSYRSSHISVERGRELSLVEHTQAALDSRDVAASSDTVKEALLAAFDGSVEVREGTTEALTAAAATGPVGILSNCSLPGLVEQTLSRVDIGDSIDTVVTSVGCGWRKPHDRAFAAVADELGVDLDSLVHVGDDARTDGGARTTDATVVLLDDVPLREFPAWLEESAWD